MPDYRGADVTDLVVVVPGILGSSLTKDGAEVWGTGLRRLLTNVATFGRVVKKGLAIPAGTDPDDPRDGVRASGLITGFTVIPGLLGTDFYDSLKKNLRKDLQLAEKQLQEFAYDWRLSSRVNGPLLAKFLDEKLTAYQKQSGRKDARAILVCHSMGGLVARWCVEKADGARFVRTIVTIGTPYKGSVLALDAVANGVRMPRKIGVDLTELARTLPALYELLPTYRCVELDGAAPRNLADDDVLARVVSLCEDAPSDVADRIRRGLSLHDDLAAAVTARARPACKLIAFRGAEQPTLLSAVVDKRGLKGVEEIGGVVRGGDSVVPDDSAVPPEWAETGAAKLAGGKHSSLPNGNRLREELRVALRHAGRLLAPPARVSSRAPWEARAGKPFEVEITPLPDENGDLPNLDVQVTVDSLETARGASRFHYRARQAGAIHRATVDGLPPGLYRLLVERASARARVIDDLADSLVVFEDD
ncbi:esterase/lipase family protein [Paractinoplanes globisporus]|uniref:Esterase/lipase family protein n=1 Tax=Paractinoplanes globisporus TaxID=113565 RepID=A0ABW6WWJ1_9ACTN|nr:hypothetical protein [Actinoplanes globisporus]